MSEEMEITAEYFREYRRKLGFPNQNDAKNFFGAKDISPTVDFSYVELLNKRLYELVQRIDGVISDSIKAKSLKEFKREYIEHPFKIMKANKIFPLLNNQGRRPEQVYFSWMRGFVISNFFLGALGLIFDVDAKKIALIGDDDLKNVDTFKRTPKADLEIKLNGMGKIRIEIQSGFTGINDIKQHKVLEAKRVFQDLKIPTLAIHFDLYNGQAAFLKLNTIRDDSVNWITRQQMEGQTVFNIDQNHFVWKLTEPPKKYSELILD